MSENKLSSNELPEKFTEWLLAMGCPPNVVPPIEKIYEMCRGHYMVWRSLMETVEPRNIVHKKKLQVFCDDVLKWQKLNSFSKYRSDVIEPEELTLWKQQTELREKLAVAEAKIEMQKENLHQKMEKLSSKLSQCVLYRKHLQDSQRRSRLLTHVAKELKDKESNLLETKAIADSLCNVNDIVDVESKIEKCVLVLSQNGSTKSVNAATCSSAVSTKSDYHEEDHVSGLMKCHGDALFKQLLERRVALCAALNVSNMNSDKCNKIGPRSVLTHTAALHCSLALDALKNRVHVSHTRNKLAETISKVGAHLSGKAGELLVSQCQQACSEARIETSRKTLEELSNKEGVFSIGSHHTNCVSAVKDIHTVDRAIESKRDELKRLIVSVSTLERKTQNARECLLSMFNSIHGDVQREKQRVMSGQQSTQSMSAVRQFYKERLEKHKNKLELSMELESDNCSITDNANPKFVDELKFYLKKFNLEKNRKLILESGEKIWIFETVENALHSVYSQWESSNITTSLLCPSISLEDNFRHICDLLSANQELVEFVRAMDSQKLSTKCFALPTVDEEQKTLDKIKKTLNDSIKELRKTNKNVDKAMEDLQYWSDNNIKKYISTKRTVDGRTYKEYEKAYLQSLRI